ncbi:MAG TPA: glucose-1-phosphate cytidylyltransferase [Gaiellaceae bacterium]|jgi:glucose-1-phosphate cytidylyltransferase|nr:glucose-1-phosphate cytidylyltransferase [Gaiellaceae bacterium]
MKAVILAGGFGTRISEESAVRPKPMVEIGGRPILWHIMKMYSAHGVGEFVICAGYKGDMIKEYFANYFLHRADFTIDLEQNTIETHVKGAEAWKVTVVDTGQDTMTGGRLNRVRSYLGTEPFFMTYGDCVSDVDFTALLGCHREQDATVTLTAIQPPGRFGVVALQEGEARIKGFHEKPKGDGAWVNGGFFVVDPKALDHVEGDETVWEREPLEHLASQGALVAYRHTGYWQNMDTLRDKMVLEERWATDAPWKTW